jgi:hypothetical protein
VSVSNRHLSNVGWNTNTTTNYYSSDHLGSSRTLLSYWGYPTWSATYLPFGQEWNPQITVNHYKFTGVDERDSETGLDHTQFRQYSREFVRTTHRTVRPLLTRSGILFTMPAMPCKSQSRLVLDFGGRL